MILPKIAMIIIESWEVLFIGFGDDDDDVCVCGFNSFEILNEK